MEENNTAHGFCLIKKLQTSSIGSYDFSSGLHRANEITERDLTNFGTAKGNFQVEI